MPRGNPWHDLHYLSPELYLVKDRSLSNIEQSIAYVPPTHTNVVNPPSSLGQPSGAQPIIIQSSGGYGYHIPVVIADFTTPSESHLYGLPLSLCRLFGPRGPFLYL